ncbi:hypothetical protein ACWD3I_38235 [Streptomyces sp. NPDC002817]
MLSEPIIDRLETVKAAEEDRQSSDAAVPHALRGDGVHVVVVRSVVCFQLRRLHRSGAGRILTETGREAGEQLGGVRQTGERVVGCAVGEFEHAAGNRSGLHTAITRIQQINRTLDCDLETETEDLIRELFNAECG